MSGFRKFLLWLLAFVITIAAAWYQRKTGPTYPKRVSVTLNDTLCNLRLVRSLSLDERPVVKLGTEDTTIRAILYYKRFRSEEEYRSVPFTLRTYPLESFIMNKIFKITEEKGLFADVPQQPPAGKLQYFIEITDSNGTQTLMREEPAVMRFKGAVPGIILTPHIITMFLAMLFSTGAGLLAIAKIPSYRKYGIWTLALLTAGGIILGPVVQKYAFGAFWTGFPLGLDLTDNKTLIAFIFWIVAVIMNREKERPLYTIIAAAVLLLIFSVPHSLFGSELDFATGEVTQGIVLFFFGPNAKKNLN